MTAKSAMKISETYRDPRSLASNALSYFVDRSGLHTVVHHMHAGEEIAGLCHAARRFDTVEDARAEWKRLRGVLAARGYTDRVS